MAALQHIDSPERGVLLLDANLHVTGANRRAAELLGSAPEDLVGSALPPAFGRRPAHPEEIVEEVLGSACGDGTVIHRCSSPVYSRDGVIAGRVEIYSDITARRELEREIVDRNSELLRLNHRLQDAQEQLVQSERLRTLGEMAAGIAHDINNVLGIILGNVQLAKRKIEPGHPLEQCVQAIELATRDAAETVRRLREIGKPVDTSHHRPVDLSEVAADVVGSACPAWREHGVAGGNVDVRIEPAEGCLVTGDAAEIREALANILLNAVQATDAGGAVTVSTYWDSEWIELSVRDNGVGMNHETRKRLFDPFFTTRGAQGTGLGMSMVDAIMIRHGGRVVVESKEGSGTLVVLRFPAAQSR